MPESNTIGVVSAPGASYVETFDREKKLAKNALLLESDGKVHEDTDFDPINEFSVKGKGDLAVGIASGQTLAVDDTIVVGSSAGKTLVTETTEGDKAAEYNEWSFTARNYPGAS